MDPHLIVERYVSWSSRNISVKQLNADLFNCFRPLSGSISTQTAVLCLLSVAADVDLHYALFGCDIQDDIEVVDEHLIDWKITNILLHITC